VRGGLLGKAGKASRAGGKELSGASPGVARSGIRELAAAEQ